MKTLGFSSQRIFKMVLMESFMLTFLGGIIGLLVATLFLGFLNNAPQFPIADLILTKGIILQAVGVMILLGLITGIIPAVNALRLNIVTALSRR
jgi:putative ABC transport system permease protein